MPIKSKAQFRFFQWLFKSGKPSEKKLAKEFLKTKVDYKKLPNRK